MGVVCEAGQCVSVSDSMVNKKWKGKERKKERKWRPTLNLTGFMVLSSSNIRGQTKIFLTDGNSSAIDMEKAVLKGLSWDICFSTCLSLVDILFGNPPP